MTNLMMQFRSIVDLDNERKLEELLVAFALSTDLTSASLADEASHVAALLPEDTVTNITDSAFTKAEHLMSLRVLAASHI